MLNRNNLFDNPPGIPYMYIYSLAGLTNTERQVNWQIDRALTIDDHKNNKVILRICNANGWYGSQGWFGYKSPGANNLIELFSIPMITSNVYELTLSGMDISGVSGITIMHVQPLP